MAIIACKVKFPDAKRAPLARQLLSSGTDRRVSLADAAVKSGLVTPGD